MAVILTTREPLQKVVSFIEPMSDEELEFLLVKLRAQKLKEQGIPKTAKKPAKREISAATLTKWKHASRKQNAA